MVVKFKQCIFMGSILVRQRTQLLFMFFHFIHEYPFYSFSFVCFHLCEILYQPRPASFSSGFMVSQLIPTMASPRPVLHSARTAASL